MSIVGFSLSKIDVVKSDAPHSGNLNISSNIRIRNIEAANFNIGQPNQGGLKLSFEFSSVYGNNVAHIILGGNVLFLANNDRAKKVLEDWNKAKKINQDFLQAVLNHIYTKCNVHAVSLSKDMSLPPPVPMPRLSVSAKENASGKEAGSAKKPAKKAAKKPAKKAAKK